MSVGKHASDPVIALVVAMGDNGAIGRGGDLPWHLGSDMRYFRQVTMGKPIVMGRRTFKSLPRVLDGRLNIVLTRDRGFVAPDAVMAYCLEEGLEAARRSAARTGADEIMVIGGEDVFREVLPQAGRIYLTEVHASPDADTWFPTLDSTEWQEVSREKHAAGPKDDYPFSFVLLERR
ncbi:MAG: dihydrofolate reductase [Methyloceanibacter sp.]|uniref:dihydrofolate reductase n=1 Tax=Methyloceanibacter sp. TaxID=1965321 RepID=UPI003D9B1EA6